MPKDLRAAVSTNWVQLGDENGARALALHCALAHSGAWLGVIKALEGRLSVAAFDMPGHGQSDAWDGHSDYHDQVTDIAETFMSGGITLLGHSFGATVALRLAERHPDMVRRMVLIEPVLFAVARDTAPGDFADRRAASQPMADALARGDTATAARIFTATWGLGRSWDAMGARAQALLQDQMWIVAQTDQALSHDANGLLRAGRLEACRMPVLFLRGASTEPILSVIHAGLMARLPDAREEVIDGAGHMAPITHPDAVASRIAAFLDTT
ncbi:alpha/beta fold hydrolase [Roseivivax sp. CAU 1753]